MQIRDRDLADWLSHTALRHQFNIFTEKGLLNYIIFLSTTSSDFRFPDYFIKTSNSNQNQIPSSPPVTIDSILEQIWRTRADLQNSFDLKTNQGKAAFFIWFLSQGHSEYPFTSRDIPDLESNYLNGLAEIGNQTGALPLKMLLLWLSSESLQRKFDLRSNIGQLKFKLWYKLIGGRRLESGIQSLNSAASFKQSVVEENLYHKDNIALPVQKKPTEPVPSRSAPTDFSGVNVIGPISGTFGLAEHVRYVAKCLSQADVSCAATDFHSPHTRNRTSKDNSAFNFITDSHPFGMSLFCANPDWLFYLIGSSNKHLLQNKFSVQYGYWELSKLPSPWIDLLGNFNEIWAPTQFIKQCLDNHNFRSVVHMPPAVSINETFSLSRKDFGLPERTFIFHFSFDGFSFVHRKNPIAVVKAFETAFPNGTEQVSLVIKSRNFENAANMQSIADYLEFLELVKEDPRIFLFEEDFDRQQVHELINVCDAYISLHRAEGFGYGMAESMFLGKPVIATNYSGNLDFTKPDNSCLVNCDLIPVKPDQYIFSDGQVWADPDINQAAWYMQKLLDDDEYRVQIAKRGKYYIRHNHSLEEVGNRYRKRIGEIIQNF
jgi:glycosyltransferase involved in cell wall biosynthesis